MAKQKQEELQKQAELLKSAFAEAALKERATRLGILDQVLATKSYLHHLSSQSWIALVFSGQLSFRSCSLKSLAAGAHEAQQPHTSVWYAQR